MTGLLVIRAYKANAYKHRPQTRGYTFAIFENLKVSIVIHTPFSYNVSSNWLTACLVIKQDIYVVGDGVMVMENYVRFLTFRPR